MIHYHGTPITPNSMLEMMAGRHFCVSWARPDQLKHCLRVGQSVMFDNGAFSAHTQPLRFDKKRNFQFDDAKFYAWLEPILAHPHWAVIPDVIDGSVEEQREMLKRWPFGDAYGIPVWHMGLPLSYLLELCDRFGRVCFGSAGEYWQIGTPKWAGRMDAAFNALVKTFGARLPWVHGLRMLAQGDGQWPLSSADSTNLGRNFKHQDVCIDCFAKRIDAVNPPSLWVERELQTSLLE